MFCSKDKDGIYLLITNIPSHLRSKDLRNYFSYFIEKNAFCKFHYRHRPEDIIIQSLKILKQNVLSSYKFDNSDNNNKTITSDSITKPIEESNDHSSKKIYPQNLSLEETYSLERNDYVIDNNALKNIHLEKSYQSFTVENKLSDTVEKEVLLNRDEIYTKKEIRNCDLQENISILDDIIKKSVNEPLVNPIKSNNVQEVNPNIDARSANVKDGRCCCLILIKESFLESFKSLYNQKFWVNKDGIILPIRCFIYDFSPILHLNKSFAESGESSRPNYTKAWMKEEKPLALDKIYTLKEFKPPRVMPQGNVGTSNSNFKALLDQCKLPTSIITNLGLDFSKRIGKKYTRLDFNYKTSVCPGGVHSDSKESIFTEGGDLIPGYFDIKFNMSLQRKNSKSSSGPVIELEPEEEDGAEVEEWERFEAFHDDVTKQERTKERVFESEIEQVWEKGGPGLVFYTDAQFWRVYEGEEAEKETDEWDVDVAHFYKGGSCDLDAKDSVSMMEMDKLRSGEQSSAFVSKEQKPKALAAPKLEREKQTYPIQRSKKRKAKGKKADVKDSGEAIGDFEQHSKGFGSQMLKLYGWKEGEGLGRDKSGMAVALDPSWKHPHDKRGFGFKQKPKKHKREPWNQDLTEDGHPTSSPLKEAPRQPGHPTSSPLKEAPMQPLSGDPTAPSVAKEYPPSLPQLKHPSPLPLEPQLSTSS